MEPSWDYFYIGDTEPTGTDWERLPEPSFLAEIISPKRKSSLVKILAPEILGLEEGVVLTLDASMAIRKPLEVFLEEYWAWDTDLLVADHPTRTCLYSEIAANLDLGFDDPSLLSKVRVLYESTGVPRDFGLFSTRVMVHNPSSTAGSLLRHLWAKNYLAGSIRDQISLPLSLWEAQNLGQQPRIRTFDFSKVFNDDSHFSITPHLKSHEWA